MSEKTIHQCECEHCQGTEAHRDKESHHRLNIFLSRLDEQQKRWYAAIEAERIGHGGTRQVSQITGLSEPTIRRGRAELEEELATRPRERIRLTGGGRKRIEKKVPLSRRA